MAIADIRTSAGSTISISSSQPATYDAAGFGALSYTAIAEVSNLGEFGPVSTLVTFNPLATRTTIKRKGSLDQGSIDLEMARSSSDAGQVLLAAANASDLSYSYKVVIQDGSVFMFTAQCLSFSMTVGSVDDITMMNASLEVDSAVIEV